MTIRAKSSSDCPIPARGQISLGKIFRKITSKLNSGAEMEALLDFTFETLSLVIPFDRMGIALLDDSGDRVRLRWAKAKEQIHFLKLGYSAPLVGSSLQGIIQSGEPRIINDLTEYARQHPQSESTQLALKDGIKSSLTCPLRANNRAVGFVFFSSYSANVFRTEHVRSFLDIAEELSVIVEQGRLKNFFEVSKSKSQTLATVLHDLRSPLSVIQGFIEMSLQEDWFKDLSEEGRKIFSILHRNTEHMFCLLNELTDLSRLDRKGAILCKENVNLLTFLNDVATDAHELARKKAMDFALEFGDDLPKSAAFDPNKIRQAIDNLLTNAVKFSNRGSRFCLSVKIVSGRIYFSVEDQGQGIPADELPGLFREFGRTSVRPTEGESSTGLGLAIAKRIVEQHEGHIDVRSEVGRGSIFSFSIPI